MANTIELFDVDENDPGVLGMEGNGLIGKQHDASRLPRLGRNVSIRGWWNSLKLHVLRRRKLAISLAVFLSSGIAANVCFKLELNAMYNYPLFTSQLNPIILAILFGLGLNVEVRCSDSSSTRSADHDGKHTNLFTRAVAWKLAVISVFDVTANVIELNSSDEMGKDAGPLSMLLAQCVIPFTMLFSLVLLRRRYNAKQVLGAAIIIGGVLVVVLPPNVHTHSKSVFWTVMYVVSRVPTSLNKVIKEHLFAREAVTVLFVGFWEQTLNVAIGALSMFLCYPVIKGVALSDVPQRLHEAMWCALGRNSMASDDCARAPWLILLFNISAVIWMGSTLAVVKHGSATLAFLASAVLIPLSDAFFASRKIFGADAKSFHWFDIVGLLVIVGGMLAYAMGSLMQDRRRRTLTFHTADDDTGQVQAAISPGSGGDLCDDDNSPAISDGRRALLNTGHA